MEVFFLIILLLILFILIGIFVKRRQIKIYYIKKKFSKSKEKNIMNMIFNKNFLFFQHLEDHFKEKSTRQKVSIQSKSISNEKEGHLRKVRKKGGDDDSKGFNIYY